MWLQTALLFFKFYTPNKFGKLSTVIIYVPSCCKFAVC